MSICHSQYGDVELSIDGSDGLSVGRIVHLGTEEVGPFRQLIFLGLVHVGPRLV